MILVGVIFVATGFFAVSMPLLAPTLLGMNPAWMSVLGGVLFWVVGCGLIRIERDPKSLPRWAGLICAAVGAFIVIMAGFDPDESRFHAPRWVVGAAGATFLFGGLAAIRSGSAAYAAAVEHSAGYALILALLLTCFGAVATWMAFGSGEREFEGSLTIGGGVLPFDAGELLGRIVFSPAALLLDFMALAAWLHLARCLARRPRSAAAGRRDSRPDR